VIETAAALRRLVPPKTWTASADGVARLSASLVRRYPISVDLSSKSKRRGKL